VAAGLGHAIEENGDTGGEQREPAHIQPLPGPGPGVRRTLLAEGGLLAHAETGDAEALDRLRAINQVITASPALLAREQQAINQAAVTLASVLAADVSARPGDLRPQVAANALIGVHRALLDYVRHRVQTGENPTGLAAEVRKLTTDAFELLEQGLRDYAAKPADTTGGAR
jgi:hypothetical protein